MTGPQPKLFEVAPIELHQFLMVIKPNDRVHNKTMELKRDFSQRFNIDTPLRSLPHVTIAAYAAPEKHQEAIMNKIREFTAGAFAFRMKLVEIDGFAEHTIYIKFDNKGLAVKTFIAQVRKVFDKHFTPHLTIARALSPDVYKAALQHYAKIEFSDFFTVSSLVLLKRKGPNEPFKHVFEFKFAGKAEVTE